ncbi:hypothetical protein GCM10009546_38340 [Actinomadura livida]|uniref:Uncharacterized protein n=1 Tax=Actinomadura livida TaxID=79909 RepID=A0ABP3PVF6_9ACTN
MTASAETVPSVSPSGSTGCDVPDADGSCDPGTPVGAPSGGVVPGPPPGGAEGDAGTDAGGVGAGDVAWAPPGTATAETHVAANAAPQTRTLRTPVPFFTNLARRV